MHVPTIRPAAETDLPRLVEVEVAAGQLFHTVGMPLVAADVPQIAVLRKAVLADRIWVAVVGAQVAGYISAEVVDGNAHIAQVSVAPDYARRGIGKAMIEFVEAWGRTAGCPATTLTTFRDVPWNGPYYLRLSYEVLADSQIGPELARIMEHEASLPGIDASLRCAMTKPNDSPPTGTS
ncbi:MAG TPA: GNAT family N-acetyltransferase [Propionibacterium sp.]|nr:GNAT family N-acetyltransferase [Propionibacterium sp.]